MFFQKQNYLCLTFESFPAVFRPFGRNPSPLTLAFGQRRSCEMRKLSVVPEELRWLRLSGGSAAKILQRHCNELCEALKSAAIIYCSAAKAVGSLKDLRWPQHDV